MNNEEYSRELIEYKILQLKKDIQTIKDRIALEHSLAKEKESKLERLLIKYKEMLDVLAREQRVIEYQIITAKNNYYSEKVREMTTRNKHKKKSRKPYRMRAISKTLF